MTDVSALPPDWQEYFKSLEHDVSELKKKAHSPAELASRLDTRSSLAIAIVGLMMVSIMMLVMLSLLNVKVDPTIFAVLTTLLGVLAGSFKDVYGFWYGSSSGSSGKDDAITKMAAAASGTGNNATLVAPLQPLTTPLPTTTGAEVTSVSGTTAPEDKKP